MSDLKIGLSSLDDDEEGSGAGISNIYYKEAVKHLWGNSASEQHVPEAQSYHEGDMPGSIRVACASNTAEQVDGYFGTCLRFLIYQVVAGEKRLVDVRSCAAAHRAEDKNAYRAQLRRRTPRSQRVYWWPK